MTDPARPHHRLAYSPAARRSLAHGLPEAVAAAAYELITGPLRAQPYRLGKQLGPPFDGQHGARRGPYRVRYTINDATKTITIVDIDHRRDAYHT